MEQSEFIVGYSRAFTKWWLRTRVVTPAKQDAESGLWHAMHEIYVPWWAWPLELAHRAIFGRTILTKPGL